MFREAGIECRASHSGGGSSSSTGRGSRGRTFTGPAAAASAATTAVAAALSLSALECELLPFLRLSGRVERVPRGPGVKRKFFGFLFWFYFFEN